VINDIAKLLILAGVALIAAGVVVWVISKTSLGRLPGDIIIHRRNFTFAFPVVTCILVSVVLTVLLWIISRLKH